MRQTESSDQGSGVTVGGRGGLSASVASISDPVRQDVPIANAALLHEVVKPAGRQLGPLIGGVR